MAKSVLRSCLSGLTIAIAGFMPIAASSETLADALASAYENSGLLDQNRALLRAADEDVVQAAAALKPVLNYVVRANTVTGDEIRSSSSMALELSASLLIYDFGSARFTRERQKETVLATRNALLSVEQQVLQSAVDAFMDVISASKQVELRQSNVRLITEELRAARDRFEVGEVTRTDVALAESRLASARAGLASSEGELARSNAAYREAVGRAPSRLVAPSATPDLPRSVQAARALARDAHPSVLEARHTAEAADLAALSVAATILPSVDLTARSTQTFPLDSAPNSRTDVLELRLSGPISQGGRVNSLVRQAEARRDAANASIHVVGRQVDAFVDIAYANLAVARASRDASERQIRAARVAFQGVREEATLGARTTLDVLDAEQELLDAQANRITAISDEFKAAYAVLAAAGLLNASHLGLGVQIYDPAGYYNLVKGNPRGKSRQGDSLDRVLQALSKK